jgi:hypothetical protein
MRCARSYDSKVKNIAFMRAEDETAPAWFNCLMVTGTRVCNSDLAGNAKIEFMDEKGKVTQRIPDTAPKQ